MSNLDETKSNLQLEKWTIPPLNVMGDNFAIILNI